MRWNSESWPRQAADKTEGRSAIDKTRPVSLPPRVPRRGRGPGPACAAAAAYKPDSRSASLVAYARAGAGAGAAARVLPITATAPTSGPTATDPGRPY